MTLALLLTAVTGAWADVAYYVVGNFTDWSTNPAYKMTLNTECTSTTEYMLTLDLPANAQFKVVKDDGQGQTWYPDGMGNAYGENGELSGAGKYTVYFRPNGDGNPDWFYGVMYVAAAEPEPGTVTLNDTKTEASFDMPTYDMTVDYELVRDMSVQMQAQVGDDATKQPRYRVKKNEQTGLYEPAEMDYGQVLALFSVNDGIEQKALTLNQDYYCRIYKLDEQTLQPEGDGVTLYEFDFAPGLYALKAFAMDDSDYDGETALSNTFKLFEGIPVVVPPTEEQGAGEEKVLGTLSYINDEFNLTLDANAGAKLYVITGVGTETATATEVTEVPKGKPFFVLNEEDTENNVTLLPVDDAQVTTTVTPAAEFLGTLVDKTFTADEMAADDYYVLQGGAFVFVKNAGTLAANHCYLKVAKDAAARRLKIVFGDEDTVTGIEGVKEVEGVEDDRFFDLNGRQLDGTPTRKGLYIRNGKKVVKR